MALAGTAWYLTQAWLPHNVRLYGLRDVHGDKPALRRLLAVLCACCWPPHFFASLLFYTDAIAGLTLAVAATKILQSSPHISPSGQARHTSTAQLIGWCVAAIACRQTAIVWVGLAVGAVVMVDVQGIGSLFPSSVTTARHAVRAVLRRIWRDLTPGTVPSNTDSPVRAGVCTALLFGAFLWINGGVALGDVQHHSMGAHLTQLAWLGCVLLPWAVSGGVRCARQWATRRSKAIAVVLTLLLAIAAGMTAQVHPFILADNRHVPFYLCRYLLCRSSVAAALAILCGSASFIGVAWCIAYARPMRHKYLYTYAVVGAVCWVLGAAGSLVPSPLVEPRYFTPALAVAWALMPVPARTHGVGLVAMHVLNLVAVLVFCLKSFRSPDGSTGRIMW